MSTHITHCIVCESDVSCCDEVHALGCGGPNGAGGCKREPFIEFCSIECFEELERRMAESKANFMDCWGHWDRARAPKRS